MKQKNRKCRGCEKIFDRTELIKITKLQNGLLKINPDSAELGRSVYVCNNIVCIKNFIKKKRLKSALKYSNASEILRIETELLNLFK